MKRLAIAARKAGAEVTCPSCMQPVIVPTPEPPKAIPGILIEHLPPSDERASDPDGPQVVDEPENREPHRAVDTYREPDDEYDPLPIRRRRNRGPQSAVVVGIGIIALVAVFMVVGAFVRHEKAKAMARATESPAFSQRAVSPQRPAREDDDSPGVGDVLGALVGSVGGFLCLAFCLAFYFTPSIVAIVRRHNNIAPILVVNFFLGWLLVGWVISLAWAFTDLKQLENRRRSWL